MVSRCRGILVFTTIFDTPILEDYYRNFQRFGHLDDVEAIVIPDRKTPESTYARCRDLNSRGLRTTCPTIEEQEYFLRSIGVPPHAIPYDSDNRRNVGYLMALEAHPDFVISIDDDNYCMEDEDVFAEHAVTCSGVTRQVVADSSTSFFNICSLLRFEHPTPVYPRGYPYARRHQSETILTRKQLVPVSINAGLWTIDPDVDGITWLVAKPRVTDFTGRSVALGSKTWSPLNTQNTGLATAAIPAYYFVRMAYPMAGTAIDRYGDIFSGYFVQACTKQVGGCVRFGSPIAEHRRNSHNYMRDATNEWACILVLEDLLPWLTEVRLSGRTYSEAYLSLAEQLECAVEEFRGSVWTDATRGYFHQMAYHMRLWLRSCAAILGARFPASVPYPAEVLAATEEAECHLVL